MYVVFFGIIVMAIGKRGCAMCRNGKAQAKAKAGSNQSEKNKVFKKIIEHLNTSGKFHFVNYK